MTRSDQLFPKPRKRMKQPRKDTLRHTIRCRDAEIFRLKAELSKPGLLMRVVGKARGLFKLIKRAALDKLGPAQPCQPGERHE